MRCGCLRHVPACPTGQTLFAALLLAQQQRDRSSGAERERLSQVVAQLADAYREHVDRWREGDLKVQRREGGWQIERRVQAQWIVQGVIGAEEPLRSWLKTGGFWRYAQLNDGSLQDRHTGYYHQRRMPFPHAHLLPDLQQETSLLVINPHLVCTHHRLICGHAWHCFLPSWLTVILTH